MSDQLVQAATALSETFMPAERIQSAAAVQAAKTLVVALEARKQPEFSNAAIDAAMNALVRGLSHSVEADTAFREAHRKFSKVVGHTALPELGWGCEGECPSPRQEHEPLRAVA